MYCGYCGKQIDDDSAFCPYCGKKTQTSPQTDNEPPRKKKPGRGWLVLIILVILVSGIFGIEYLVNAGQRPWGSNNSKDVFEAYYKPFSNEDVVYENDEVFVASQLLLTVEQGTSKHKVEGLVGSMDGVIAGYISISDDYQIVFPNGKTYNELYDIIDVWSRKRFVENVELHYVFQDNLDVVAYQDPGKETGKDDDTGSEWSEAQPDGLNWWAEAVMDIDFETVNVGIFDSMFQTDHVDLDGLFVKTWQNPDNVAELYHDAVERHNDDNTVKVANYSHGTHVAGLIAARANGRGIVGTSQNVDLYGFAAHGEAVKKYVSVMEYKYAFALFFENGVKVINISMGMGDEASISAYLDWQDQKTIETSTAIKAIETYNNSLEAFLKKCLLKYDFLIVKAAGNSRNRTVIRNENPDRDHPYSYMISENLNDKNRVTVSEIDISHQLISGIEDTNVRNHMIVVGSVDLKYKTQLPKSIPYCEPSDFSLLGADVYAPGGTMTCFREIDNDLTPIMYSYNILSDIPGNNTEEMAGTSMATPIVSGIAALVWGVNPNLTGDEVCTILMNSALYGACSDSEVVNSGAAVTEALNSRTNGTKKKTEITTGTLMGYIDENTGITPTDIAVYDKSGDKKVRDIALLEELTFVEFMEPGDYILRTGGYDDISFTIRKGEVTYLVVSNERRLSSITGPFYSSEFYYASPTSIYPKEIIGTMEDTGTTWTNDYVYDESDRVAERHWLSLNVGYASDEGTFNYYYDDSGRLIRIERSITWGLELETETQEYMYNQDGLRTQSNLRVESLEGYSTATTYEYDNNGILVSSIEKTTFDSGSEYTEVTSYEFVDDKLFDVYCESGEYYVELTDANGTPIFTLEIGNTPSFEYDASGYMIRAGAYRFSYTDVNGNSTDAEQTAYDCIEAYADILSSDCPALAELVDVDFDGIPELLCCEGIGANGFGGLSKAYTYKDGAVREIVIDVNIPHKVGFDGLDTLQINGAEYRLFVNEKGGESRLEIDTFQPCGAYHSYSYTGVLKLENNLTYEDVFESAWDDPEVPFDDDVDCRGRTYWYCGTELGSEDEYNAMMDNWHDGWSEVSDYVVVVQYFGNASAGDIRDFLASYPW